MIFDNLHLVRSFPTRIIEWSRYLSGPWAPHARRNRMQRTTQSLPRSREGFLPLRDPKFSLPDPWVRTTIQVLESIFNNFHLVMTSPARTIEWRSHTSRPWTPHARRNRMRHTAWPPARSRGRFVGLLDPQNHPKLDPNLEILHLAGFGPSCARGPPHCSTSPGRNTFPRQSRPSAEK